MMSMDYLAEARSLSGELLTLREEFHRHPELGNREFKTAERVERYLEGCGIQTERLLGTAVVGRLTGGLPGPFIALRADMDALPIQESTGAEFTSNVPGVMHACGHDVHLAAALGAARILSRRREELPGTLVLLFQPDEEGNGGAERMIDAGAVKGVSAVFGAHVTPDLPVGDVGVRYGKFYAASDTFHVSVRGRSAHGAERERGIDALAAAAKMVPALLDLPHSLPDEKSVLSIGTFHAGTAGNVVADHAEFDGILRTLGPVARMQMRSLVLSTIRTVADQCGASVHCALHESYPGIVNDGAATQLVEMTAREVLGEGHVHVIESPVMTTEDFGYFLQICPGAFYHVGAGCPLPLHNAGFLPDGDAVITAAAFHAAVIARAMRAWNDGSSVP